MYLTLVVIFVAYYEHVLQDLLKLRVQVQLEQPSN